MMQVIGYIVGFMGFFILLGTAGADCDGKCMENSLTIVEMMQGVFMGIGLMMVGTYFVMKGE
tara:strand:+ start:1497 stop:1682 length:186 start_codon:yes stop_codon:yes gene_type:complete